MKELSNDKWVPDAGKDGDTFIAILSLRVSYGAYIIFSDSLHNDFDDPCFAIFLELL